MSSYKTLSNAPVFNTIGETIWDSKQPSNTWIKENQILSQSTYSSLYSKIGLIKNGLYSWTYSRSNTTNNIFSIIYANGLYVRAGVAGALGTSTDAITWTARTSGVTTDINALTYGNGLFVYVGASGVVRTSTNAITWTARSSGSTGYFRHITYGNGVYVLGGNSGELRTSTDAITWSAVSTTDSKVDTSNSIGTLNYLNNLFIYTQASSLGGRLATSTNGTIWSLSTLPSPTATNISTKPIYNNGVYYLFDNNLNLLTSTDAITWTNTSNLRSVFGFRPIGLLTYADGYYICNTGAYQGKTVLATSTNLTAWQFIDSNICNNVYDYIYANGKHVMAGQNGITCWTTDYTYNPTTEFVTPIYSINNKNSSLYFKGI